MQPPSVSPDSVVLADRYRSIRAFTEELCETLEPEDFVIQSMTDCSPIRWHLAHTTWFFETFVLGEFQTDYRPLHDQYAYLFNSYYIQAGERFDRPRRGLLSRPTVSEIMAYRAHVDAAIAAFLSTADTSVLERVRPVLEIGLNHEQQHQELMLTDAKHMLSQNPLNPVFREIETTPASASPLGFVRFEAGIRHIGHEGDGFSYDNEGPRHRVFLEPFELGHRPVSNAEYALFVEEGGYRNPLLWLSEGWTRVQEEDWTKPIYWERHDQGWYEFTLAGVRALDPHAPVCHLSYFEADAYARWRGMRLPTEFEWEAALGEADPTPGHYVEDRLWHPAAAVGDGLRGMMGDLWEWTSSSYGPYPGYTPPPGALGEYNGKFMCNQYVLRGGSCATSRTHIRPTYRNFFPAYARWQFTGIRLARTVK
ncbi:MAG: ergothioneine biosynthesis protein EgtB [Rhodothermales bacterium]|nr:ergothioneine biosynthesis protein EgtB [Rhodothermales bacterium]MBO6780124.1 ergothioneine biosynthesis protein EgtB [Rhodothermales bacterium]